MPKYFPRQSWAYVSRYDILFGSEFEELIQKKILFKYKTSLSQSNIIVIDTIVRIIIPIGRFWRLFLGYLMSIEIGIAIAVQDQRSLFIIYNEISIRLVVWWAKVTQF